MPVECARVALGSISALAYSPEAWETRWIAVVTVLEIANGILSYFSADLIAVFTVHYFEYLLTKELLEYSASMGEGIWYALMKKPLIIPYSTCHHLSNQ